MKLNLNNKSARDEIHFASSAYKVMMKIGLTTALIGSDKLFRQ